MASFYARNGAGDLLARYSFIEPLLEGRRVLEIGGARATDGGSALFLAERGAAAVLSVEPAEEDLERARDAGHHPFVQFRASAAGDLRPGAFDLVLVADGASLAREPDRVPVLRRLLVAGGRLVAALPAGGGGLAEIAGEAAAADAPEYEAFVGALSDHFALVEVATQSAMAGWVLALAADGADEPEVAMDGTLAGTPETAAYLAICGEEPCGLSGLSVVALPVQPLLDAAREAHGAREDSGEARRLLDDAEAARQAALAELSTRAQELDASYAERDEALKGREAARTERDQAISSREAALAELADARAARIAAELAAEEGRGMAAAAEAGLERLRTDTSGLVARARELESLLEAEREAAFEARAALDRIQAAEAERAREAEDARAAAAAQADAATRVQAELAERRGAALESEAALRAARSEAQAAKSGIEAVLARAVAAEGTVAELEEALETHAREAEAARAAAEEVRSAAGEASGRVAALEDEVAKARGEVEGARSEAVRLGAELAEAKERAAALEAGAAGGEVVAAAEAARDAAREDAEQARARATAAEAAAAEAERLRGELARTEEAAREAGSVREALEAQVAELAARMESEEERLRIAEARAAEARALFETAQESQAVPRPPEERGKLEEQLEEYARARAALEMEVVALRNTTDAAEAQAAELEAELQAVRWEKDEIEQRLHAAQSTAGIGASPEAARLRDDLAARSEELARLREELARKEESLEERGASAPTAAAPDPGAVKALEDRLAEALQRAADAEAAAEASRSGASSLEAANGTDAGEALGRAVQEKGALVAQITERDQKIARLQREVADKTDRLGRLAKEMGELKAKGLGKIFR